MTISNIAAFLFLSKTGLEIVGEETFHRVGQ
jgi:hypothetical protein